MNHSQSNSSPQRKTQSSHFLTTPGDHLTRSEQNLESETPFCRTCTANQALQMNLLANYLPNETEDDCPSGSSKAVSRSEIRRLLDALPQYKESLEARYPVLCSECSPKVSAIIQKRNYKSKAYVLHSSARRLSPLSSSHQNTHHRPEIISPFNSVGFQRPLIKGMGSRLWILQEWIWRARGVLWIISHLSGVLVNLFYASPVTLGLASLCDHERQANRSNLRTTHPICDPAPLEKYRSHLLLFHLLEFFWAFFDFTWSQVRQNKAQGIHTKIIGRSSYLCFNAVAYILRLFSFLLTQDHLLSYLRKSRVWIPDLVPLRNPRTFGAISITLAMLFVSCLYCLRIDSPIRLTSTKKSNLQSTLEPNLSLPKPVSDEDLFSTLSLSATRSIPPNLKPKADLNQNHSNHEPPIFGKSTAFSNPLTRTSHQVEERSDVNSEFGNMDWEPIATPTAFDSCTTSPSVLLNPQTFLPPVNHRDEIGIEEIFKESVKLSSSHECRDKGKQDLKWTDWISWGGLRRGGDGSKVKDR